ncbi:MAG: 4Fe-4S dicluster domain-containing protein [Desulfovibrio sp.]|uniref:4Fe-4S dicluster domain-containing protein n=1 Tax=Desulfovibrio sp. 7SRBS1 TaxID=3378064 RepID=UPI003B423525
MAAKFIPNERIVPWLRELQDRFKVLVPAREGGSIVYRVFDGESEPALDRPSNMPPKEAVFPQTEVLLRYKYDRERDENGSRAVHVEETLPDEACLVFGTSPCGARGFQAFDPVYKGKTVDDPYFINRRERAVFVSVTCLHPTTTCFCHWVGSGPSDSDGSDVLLTPVEGGYVAEAVTEKGEALLESAKAEDGAKLEAEAEQVKAKARESLGEAEDLKGAQEKVLASFGNMEFWEKEASRCISCGACTFFCPTCYCFNITDETSGLAGERIRTWDSCMFPLFTREASGHNPRPTKAHRLRNRVQHKFAYYPSIHGGRFSCTGCGRCIRQCPSGVDIRRIVQNAMKLAPEAGGDK